MNIRLLKINRLRGKVGRVERVDGLGIVFFGIALGQSERLRGFSLLVDVSEVTLSTETPTPSAADIANGNTDVAALPVKAVRGLYYQVSWGESLDEMTPGQKVQATGKTVLSLIADVKMAKLCHLLAQTEMPILDVIAKAGYSPSRNVFVQFKKRYGQTMKAYRTNFKK